MVDENKDVNIFDARSLPVSRNTGQNRWRTVIPDTTLLMGYQDVFTCSL